MELAQAIATIEYKIATESGRFEDGYTLKMDIHQGWPPATELADAMSRKYPRLKLSYDFQANDRIQLILQQSANP